MSITVYKKIKKERKKKSKLHNPCKKKKIACKGDKIKKKPGKKAITRRVKYVK